MGTYFSLAGFVVLLFELFEILLTELFFIYVDIEVFELLVNQLITQSFLREEVVFFLIFELIAHYFLLFSLFLINIYGHKSNFTLKFFNPLHFLFQFSQLFLISFINIKTLNTFLNFLNRFINR